MGSRPVFALRRRLRRPVSLGSLRRTTPISEHWGFDRGTPVDRYYIERFLEKSSNDIRGRVLEIMDSRYTERFGAAVESSDVLDIDGSNPAATIVADLTDVDQLPSCSFDCVILTQTLQSIYDTPAALRGAYCMLRPGGVLLATVPAVSKIDPTPGVRGDYWRFTTASCERLFGDVFGASISVEAHGNVLAAAAFLYGLAREELSDRELDAEDEFFPVLITVRAVKPS
jgi:SAM-dependent methyltransferase